MTKQNTENTPRLTPGQQYMVDQVAASLAIEDMYPDEECMESLRKVAAGEMTTEQAIEQHRRKNHE